MLRLIIAGMLISTAAAAQTAGTASLPPPKVTPLMSKDLQGIAGKEGTMLLREYARGRGAPVNRHNASACVYVRDGSVVMEVRGGPEVTLTQGQTFFEGRDDVHVIGRNASTTQPARFVVVLVKDKGAPALIP